MEYAQKRQTVEGLMDHLEDFFEFGAGGGQGGEGDGVPKVSSMASYPSVIELVRCLGLCKQLAGGHYKHLIGHYSSEWRIVTKVEKQRTLSGKLDSKPVRSRERVVPAWINPRMVDRSLDFLVGAWDMGVTLELPPALVRKLRPMASEDGEGWTEWIPERDGPKAA